MFFLATSCYKKRRRKDGKYGAFETATEDGLTIYDEGATMPVK
jgi:hypothetical protein